MSKLLLRVAVLAISLLSPCAGRLVAAVIEAPATAPVYTLVRASTKAEGKGFIWFVMGPQGFVDLVKVDSGRQCVFTGAPGRYAVMLVVTGSDGSSDQGQTVILIGSDPGPTPPVPPVPPTPVPPTPSGRFKAVIIRETSESTPDLAMQLTTLRGGAYASYIQSKGRLYILDDDSLGPDGQPSKTVREWAPHYAGMTLPVLFLVDEKTGALLHKTALPATADDTLAILKKYGGP